MTSLKQTFGTRLTSSNGPSEVCYTLQEIADMMDVTKERVRQIEAKALIKVKQRFHALGHTPANLFNL